ncbi:damage-inducible protein [Amycolatopsis coloradensis]|uniref:Damage-inducible protein n=2 Tax=Amycolatopsis coloradensis TaxID=76021 RepID=A0A1R0KGI7_9PSEU|nr:damage-inducible protein [Amycolatopsis coloradensis]
MFSPQKVDKVDRERLVFAVQPGQPLPWEPDHALAQWELRPNQAWRHVVYLGIYRLDEVFEVLSRVFEPDQDSYDERPAGDTAVAAFMVGQDGRALLDSEVLSSCAWATGQVVRDQGCGQEWLAELQDATLGFSQLLRDVVTDEVSIGDVDAPPQYIPRLLDRTALADCLAAAITAAGTDKALSVEEIRISSQIVAKRNAENPAGHEFLNSFIMSDLGMVAEETAKGNAGAVLREYLRPEAQLPVDRRVDVRKQVEVVLDETAPGKVAAGRWPSQPEHALALNQQLAVSTALEMTGTSGIVGVNGPPGTGKTTMLRDLVAGLVVERARRLADLPEPGKAFTSERLSWRTQQRKRVLSIWRPELTGFEMVVASANNGAVQNVTDEIPAADAIDEVWREVAAGVDYFPEIATALLAPDKDSGQADDPGIEGWALVAARLGKKANRSRFVNTFWYHTPEKPEEDGTWHGLLAVLKGYEQTTLDRSWSDAVADFRAVEFRVEAARAKRAEVYETIQRRVDVERELVVRRSSVRAAIERGAKARRNREAAVILERERAHEAAQVAREHQAAAEQAAHERVAVAESFFQQRRAELDRLGPGGEASAERALRSRESELDGRWRARDAHQATRPGLWEQISTFGAARRKWSLKDHWLAMEVKNASHAVNTAQRGWDAAQQEILVAQRAVDAALVELESARRAVSAGIPLREVHYEPLVQARRLVALAEQEITMAGQVQAETERALLASERELAILDDRLNEASSALGDHYPDSTWWGDRRRRELTALWTDAEWNTERTELFFAALALHKAFLWHAATAMRRNLQAAMDVLSGEVPRDAPDQAVLAAWQSLFFVVPVVSTTFASYARLFGHLGKEALGWLLIDEAGQAKPQDAVGALWRTQRAVVVGDPLQLEPITALPFRAEQAIRLEFGVEERWSTSTTSVQRLADRLTALGTSIPDDEGETWVGVPLTVHRRCDQPMFDIVNAVAYDGLMINGTAGAAGQRFTEAYPTLPESKWIDVLSNEARGHWIPDEGRQLDRILDTLSALKFDMSEVMVIGPFRDIARQVGSKARRHHGLVAGTVHTSQGKQADIVILVLGSAPDRPGARNWASSKPNLLNVAVSRAKRRLYVIGDRRAWSECRHFDILAANLPSSMPIQD